MKCALEVNRGEPGPLAFDGEPCFQKVKESASHMVAIGKSVVRKEAISVQRKNNWVLKAYNSNCISNTAIKLI